MNSTIASRATYIGTATVLLELGGRAPFRILTDPALDPAGKKYDFGFGTSSRKTLDAAVPAAGLPPIDLVLLSHDEHADNLDDAGRAMLPTAGQVMTTASGARRLRPILGDRVIGLEPWGSRRIVTKEGWELQVTAVPAKHGQFPLPELLVGETIGFIVEWPGQEKGPVYFSGDTVYFSGIDRIARRYRIGSAFMNLGCVRFGVSGPLRYTFDGDDATRALRVLNPKTIIPMHFDGWTHFDESVEEATRSIAGAGLGDRIRLLPRGESVDISF